MVEKAKKHWQLANWIKKGTKVPLPEGVDYSYRVKDNITYIYCEETKTKADIIMNIRMFPIYHLGAFYHSGYFNTAQVIMKDLTLRGINNPDVKLYGYSLGGSVSSIINDIYKEQGYNVLEHVTFSELASGRGFKLKKLRKDTVRYVQFPDLMIYIQFLYRHHTKMVKLPSRESFKENHLYYHLS